jgi:hypothetical protein
MIHNTKPGGNNERFIIQYQALYNRSKVKALGKEVVKMSERLQYLLEKEDGLSIKERQELRQLLEVEQEIDWRDM